jgi:tRNA(Ile)-lysidine synthase TilS/MesJ
MQCSKCHRDSIVFQSYSGLYLCSQHIIADVEAKAKKRIRAHQWLKSGDHIAVVLSGDKTSSALLYFLKHLTAGRRDIRISAITSNDGSGDPSDTSRIRRIAELQDTDCITGSWQEESGVMTNAVTLCTEENSASPDCHPHRFLLPERIAQQHGITKIALGITLDDAAGAVLESIIRGDVERLGGKPCRETIPRISPFIAVAAAEVSLYADISGLDDEPAVHPEQGDDLHKDVNTLLYSFTNHHPATKYALLNLGEELAGFSQGIAGLIRACECYGKYRHGCCNDGSTQGVVTNGAR